MDRNTLNRYKEEFIHWMNEGKIFARRTGSGHKWEELGENSKKLFRQGYEYSIDKKTAFKPNDYVLVGDNPGIIKTIKQESAMIQLAGNRITKSLEHIEHWTPKNGDFCFFWNDGQEGVDLRVFYKEENGMNLTVNQTKYKNIAPVVGFVMGDLIDVLRIKL